MLKTTVLSARNVGFSLKKRRFLKLIRIFASIKTVYPVDYQRFSCNAQNKRFSQLNDNPPANIGCMCGQNRLFVEFIHIYRRGVIYHVPPRTENKCVIRRGMIYHVPPLFVKTIISPMLEK